MSEQFAPQPGHLIPQLDGHEVKNHCRLWDRAHFFIFCFSIADQEAFSRSAALLLRTIKALGLQKRPLFVLFRASHDVFQRCQGFVNICSVR